MSTLIYILLFTFVGSMGALIGGIILLSKEKIALKISHFLASFAAGVLLGTAFFDLLPEALAEGKEDQNAILFAALFGIIFFFLTERFIHWFHHHEEGAEERHVKSVVPLIIVGDTLHNFIDGIVIAATFLIDIPLGIVTALAVFAHEIPQEIGDFGLMLHQGLPKKKIILVNILSAAAAFAGAIITYLFGNILAGYVPVFLSVTAGFFIYIAASDLIPEIHHEKRRGFALLESFLLVAGITIVWFSAFLLQGIG